MPSLGHASSAVAGLMVDHLGLALGAFLLVVGVTHFIVPRYYEQLVPPWLPVARVWVLASGVCEIGIGAALLLTERGRLAAAWAAAGLMGVYVLTHLDALARARPDHHRWLDRPTGAVVRISVNVAYFVWAVVVALGVSEAR